ncbi:MAG: glucosaminidase domain-containing protein [Bacteroidota bacterium]
MRGIFIVALLGILTTNLSAQGAQSQEHLRYIERFNTLAMEEMVRAGIPASIKLAQGLHESGAGSSFLATRANNHFGIKCGRNWTGREAYRRDDDYDENGRLIESCFRGYRNPEASYRDHSEFLRDPAKMRYNFLFRLDPTDYASWAEGLRQAGYATDPAYPQKLIRIIETYELYRFDQRVVNNGSSIFDEDPYAGAGNPIDDDFNNGNPFDDPFAPRSSIGKYNDVTYFLTGEPITVEELARRVDLSVRRILSYNEMLNDGTQRVDVNNRVYLQPKRNSYRGRDRYHIVQEGETMFDISQRYAVKLEKLLRRNRLEQGQEPAADERIKLRGGRVSTSAIPKLAGASAAPTQPEPSTPTPPTRPDGTIDMNDDDPVLPPPGNPSDDDPNPFEPNPGTPTNGGGVIPPPPPPVDPGPTIPTNPQDDDVNNGGSVDPGPIVPVEPLPVEQFHTVIRGETLYAISRRYGLTVDRLKELNNLSGNTIQIGQRLRVQ